VAVDIYSPALLAHEQLHFDIAEVFARKLRLKLSQLSYSPENYQEKMDGVFEKILAEMEEIHDRYDRETEHGLDEKAQQKWAQMVEKKLIGQ
jgi:predicted secreted Zn-dependent protease